MHCKYRACDGLNPNSTGDSTGDSRDRLTKTFKHMLKIKIPPRSEQEETDKKPVTEAITPTAEFWAWWQREFEDPEDLMEYDVGDFKTAIQLTSIVENYVWPDFKVGVEGTWVVFRRVREKYYPRKKNKQPGLINAA